MCQRLDFLLQVYVFSCIVVKYYLRFLIVSFIDFVVVIQCALKVYVLIHFRHILINSCLICKKERRAVHFFVSYWLKKFRFVFSSGPYHFIFSVVTVLSCTMWKNCQISNYVLLVHWLDCKLHAGPDFFLVMHRLRFLCKLVLSLS